MHVLVVSIIDGVKFHIAQTLAVWCRFEKSLNFEDLRDTCSHRKILLVNFYISTYRFIFIILFYKHNCVVTARLVKSERFHVLLN